MKESGSLDLAPVRRTDASCESTTINTRDLAVPQASPKIESDDRAKEDVPPPSTASPILKAMYYWVISRR
jgi:hypothetical protein